MPVSLEMIDICSMGANDFPVLMMWQNKVDSSRWCYNWHFWRPL